MPMSINRILYVPSSSTAAMASLRRSMTRMKSTRLGRLFPSIRGIHQCLSLPPPKSSKKQPIAHHFRQLRQSFHAPSLPRTTSPTRAMHLKGEKRRRKKDLIPRASGSSIHGAALLSASNAGRGRRTTTRSSSAKLVQKPTLTADYTPPKPLLQLPPLIVRTHFLRETSQMSLTLH